MKTPILLPRGARLSPILAASLVGVFCLTLAQTVHANGTKPKKPSTKVAGKATPPKPVGSQSRAESAEKIDLPKVTVTGSLIQRTVNADGTLPITASPVCVITAQDIQRLGASNLAQALRRGVAGTR